MLLRRTSVVLVLALVWSALAVVVPTVSAQTVDGQFDGIGRLPADTVVDLQVLGRGGVPASGVDSVALNVTVTNPFFPGYLTVWPTGQPRPTASNLNFVRAQTIPNMVIVPLGADGAVSLASYTGIAHVVIDVLGWFPTGGPFTGLSPARLLDTRADGVTADGAMRATGALVGGTPIELPVAGRAGVPAGQPLSVALNLTVTNPTQAAFMTVWPSGVSRPTASNLNVVAGQTAPNMVLVPLGANGAVSIFLNRGTADVVVDVLGYVTGTNTFVGVTPARLQETRGTSGFVPLPAGFGLSTLVFDGSSLWGMNADAGLVRVDPASGAVERVQVPGLTTFMTRLVADGRYLWMGGGLIGEVIRYEPATGRSRKIALPFGMSGYERAIVDGRYVWFGGRNAVTRVDRESAAMRVYQVPTDLLDGDGDSLPVGDGVFDGRYIWFGARLFGGALGQFDTATGRFSRVPLPDGYQGTGPAMVSDGRRVWSVAFPATAGDAKALVWFAGDTGETGTIDIPTGVISADVLYAEGSSIYVSSTFNAKVVKVDTTTGATTLLDLESIADPQNSIPLPDRFIISANDGSRLWALAPVSNSLAFFPLGT